MAGHDHSHARQSLLTQLQPASLKHLDEFTAVDPHHARRRRMSQHALDLGTLQEQIASPSRHERHTCQQKLSDDGHIAIGSVQTDQSHVFREREVLQIGGDSPERRGQFLAIVAIALARIRPHPLARAQRTAPWCACAPPPRACALGSQGHTPHRVGVWPAAGLDGREAHVAALPGASHRRQRQGSGAPVDQRCPQQFPRSILLQNWTARRGYERLLSRDDPHQRGSDSGSIDEADLGAQTAP